MLRLWGMRPSLSPGGNYHGEGARLCSGAGSCLHVAEDGKGSEALRRLPHSLWGLLIEVLELESGMIGNKGAVKRQKRYYIFREPRCQMSFL